LESPEEAAQVERERERTEEQVINESMQQAGSLVDSTGNDKEGGDLDWEALNRYQEQAPASTTASKKQNDEEHPNYENMVTKASTLQDHLMAQIGEL
ncbi:hypothetical protein ACWTQZ_25970, partial [Escherichia coli]